MESSVSSVKKGAFAAPYLSREMMEETSLVTDVTGEWWGGSDYDTDGVAAKTDQTVHWLDPLVGSKHLVGYTVHKHLLEEKEAATDMTEAGAGWIGKTIPCVTPVELACSRGMNAQKVMSYNTDHTYNSGTLEGRYVTRWKQGETTFVTAWAIKKIGYFPVVLMARLARGLLSACEEDMSDTHRENLLRFVQSQWMSIHPVGKDVTDTKNPGFKHTELSTGEGHSYDTVDTHRSKDYWEESTEKGTPGKDKNMDWTSVVTEELKENELDWSSIGHVTCNAGWTLVWETTWYHCSSRDSVDVLAEESTESLDAGETMGCVTYMPHVDECYCVSQCCPEESGSCTETIEVEENGVKLSEGSMSAAMGMSEYHGCSETVEATE